MLKLDLFSLLQAPRLNRKLSPEQYIQYKTVCRLKENSLTGRLKCVWFAVSNETGRSDHISFGVLLKNLGKLPGTPDLIFMWNGGCGAIELKSDKGRQSPNQKIFESWCLELGVSYKVARSDDEVFGFLKEWGVYEN